MTSQFDDPNVPAEEEPLLTIGEIAKRLALPYWKVQRAVKHGDLPSYRVFNSRRLLRQSEVKAAIRKTRKGDAS